MPEYFKDIDALNNFIQLKKEGCILIGYQNMADYPGMVVGIGIIFGTSTAKYVLDLQWISFGLDLYGENLLENYSYGFETLESLLQYLQKKYGIHLSHIPIAYKIEDALFPNPIKDADKKSAFEKAWNQFQSDFKSGKFLDPQLKLLYSSQE